MYRFKLQSDFASQLLLQFPNTTTLTSPSDDDSFPLLWGTIVPASMMRDPPPLVSISLPSRRLIDNAVPMIEELQLLGNHMAMIAMMQSKLRVAFVM
jgi:hypothetical protein